ncbi:MAG TPA: hypothetical protein VKY65_07150 [Alphaproteobacteria bacterium]|nr:hypothetical protein [Alphaproteobacteria bacterium]
MRIALRNLVIGARKLRATATAFVLAAAVAGSLGMPAAFAADEHHRDDHGRDHREVRHERRHHEDRDWREHRPYIAPVPSYSYPPPVVYAPAPEPPGINFIFPLNFH